MNGFVRALLCASLLVPLSGSASEVSDLAQTPLLKFHVDKDFPLVGQTMKIFIQADATFSQNEVAIAPVLNTTSMTPVQLSPTLWLLNIPQFTEVKTHLLAVNIYFRNKKEADHLRGAIAKVTEEIAELMEKIDNETDPDKLAVLQQLKAERELYRSRINSQLTALRVFVKMESHSFSVAADPANPNFPYITAVNPQIGVKTGGTALQIQGTNFPTTGTNPTIKIGTKTCTFQSRTATQINCVTTAFTATGIMDVTLNFPGTPVKNAVLSDGFFVTPPTILKNVRPVAVTNGYQMVEKHQSVKLTGDASYDENQDKLSFAWKVKASPEDADFSRGELLSSKANVVFTPRKKGVYVFELVAKEISANPLTSFPAISIVEVK